MAQEEIENYALLLAKNAKKLDYGRDVENADVGFLTDGKERGTRVLCDGCRIVARSAYKVGEEVAVAQPYKNTWQHTGYMSAFEANHCPGYNNKMFVKAEKMPHRIKIPHICIERLQDISDEDCMAEGVEECSEPHVIGYPFGVLFRFFISEDKPCNRYATPRDAFAALIDKVLGKGTWDSNPYVFVYEFELIK